MPELLSGIERIAAERERQTSVEGWTPAHDDEHDFGSLISAAVAYAEYSRGLMRYESGTAPYNWPWEPEWWKPSDDPIRNLEKAGALIAAEIDRLQRAKGDV